MFLLRRKTFKVQKSSTGGNAESSGSDIFSEMDFHGLSDVLKADSWSIRSFWVATIVGSTIFAAYMSYWLLGNAVDHPTVTKIEYLSPNTVRYPVITICDRSGSFLLNQTKLAEDHIDVNIVNLMLLSGPIWTNESPDRTLVADEKRKNFLKSWEAKFNSSAEALLQFFLRYGLNCDGIFHSCRDPNWDRKNCCEMFSPVIHIRRGLCFALLPQYAPSITAPGLFSNFFLKFKNPPNLWNGNSKPGLLALEIMIDTGVDQGVWRSDAVAIDMGYWGTLKLSMTRVTTETTKATPCERHPELSYFQVSKRNYKI